MAERRIKPSELESTWICFDGPKNQACLRLSEFARMDASSELCENTYQKKAQQRVPCPDKLRPAPTTIPFGAFETSRVCDGDEEDDCAGGKSVAHYLRFLNQAVDAREFVQSGGPLIASGNGGGNSSSTEGDGGDAPGPTGEPQVEPMSADEVATAAAPQQPEVPAEVPRNTQPPPRGALPRTTRPPIGTRGAKARAPPKGALQQPAPVETDFSLFE